MQRIFLLLVLQFCFLLNSWAQEDKTTTDSTTQRNKKVGFYFSFDVRRSVVRELPVRISGLKIGITFKRNHAIGLGYYNMGRPILGGLRVSQPIEYDEDRAFVSKRNPNPNLIPARLRLEMAYASVFYEHRFLARRKWNMDVNGQFGIGNVYIYAFDQTTGRQLFDGRPKKDFVKLIEGSVSVQYKIVEWLGVGAGIGYRQMIQPNQYISTTFNYPIWAVKFILFPTKLGPVFKGQKKWYK